MLPICDESTIKHQSYNRCHSADMTCWHGVGLHEGDAGLQVASGLDGPGAQLRIPVQPGSAASRHHRVRLHQQDGFRLGGEAVATHPRQSARVVHRLDAHRSDHHVPHTPAAAAQTGTVTALDY